MGVPRSVLHMVSTGISVFAGVGLVFIVYGVVVQTTGEAWKPLEAVAVPLSNALSVSGTMMTAASIYFYSPKPRPPESASRLVYAPIVLLLSLGALAGILCGKVPTVSINGLAIIGLSGALARLYPGLPLIEWPK